MTPEPFFSWHMDLGNILTIVCVGIPAIYAVLKMAWVLGEFRPHRHDEHKGPLEAEGISYPRSMKNGK